MMKIHYQQLSRPYEFTSPFEGNEFALLLFAADPTITPAEQDAVSQSIVAQGCRYAVCCGHNCSTWDDSIDTAYLEQNNWDVTDATMVMTTWHEKETIEDIVFFFLKNTMFDDWAPTNFLVAVLGEQGDHLSEIRQEIERQEASNHTLVAASRLLGATTRTLGRMVTCQKQY